MRRGLPKVSMVNGGIGAHDFDALVFGLAVGVDLEVNRHAEEIEVLRDLAHHAEALVIAQAVDGVLGLEFRRAGGVEPLGEEPGQLLAVVLLGQGAEIVQRRRLPGVLGGKGAHGLVVFLIAHHPAQHVQDHGALVGDQRLEFGREDVELPGARERDGVVGQRADRHIFDCLFQTGLSGGLFDVARLGIAREAVAQPPVIAGRGTDRSAPPLVRDGVGQQPVVDLLGDGAAGDGGDFRRPGGGHGVSGISTTFSVVEGAGRRGSRSR